MVKVVINLHCFYKLLLTLKQIKRRTEKPENEVYKTSKGYSIYL